MRASIFISAAAFGASALAQSTSVDPFPQTSFLTQTNSQGVVTGQPGAASSQPGQPAQVTSIPAVDTSVGVPASIPAVSPGVQTVAVPDGTNHTRTLVVSANNSTTVVLNGTPTGAGASGASTTGGSRPSGSGSGSESSGSNPSATDASASESTGAAATMRAVAGGLVGAGAFVAAFL